MPRVDWGVRAPWVLHYDIAIRDPTHPKFGQRLGYGREAMARAKGPYSDSLDLYVERRDALVAAFGIATSDRILVAGCGLGFLIEAFHDGGWANCWGIDSSADIASRRATEARGDVLWVQDDMRGGGRIRTALRTMTGANTFKWIISESVLESYEDSEIPALLDAAESVLAGGQPKTNIIHMVLPIPDVALVFNRKSMAQWKAMRPTHSWMNVAPPYQVL